MLFLATLPDSKCYDSVMQLHRKKILGIPAGAGITNVTLLWKTRLHECNINITIKLKTCCIVSCLHTRRHLTCAPAQA